MVINLQHGEKKVNVTFSLLMLRMIHIWQNHLLHGQKLWQPSVQSQKLHSRLLLIRVFFMFICI